jgi:chloride channel 7
LLLFTGFNLVLALGCCLWLKYISPAGSGSGIPDVKAFLNGVEHPSFDNFFTVKTFAAKVYVTSRPQHSLADRPVTTFAILHLLQVLGSAFAVSSGLVMGKEGPMLHAGSILAFTFGRQ